MELQSTRTTLLSRIRDSADQTAWREFESRYRELLVRFAQRRGLQRADAEDVVQVVFAGLAVSLPQFVYDPRRGRFRDYLFRCTRNALSNWAQRPNRLDRSLDSDMKASAADEVCADPAETAAWEQEWVAQHYRLALDTVRQTFEPKSVEVFERSVAGIKVDALTVEFAMSEQAVHKVRQRIRARMEELIAQQIREEDEV